MKFILMAFGIYIIFVLYMEYNQPVKEDKPVTNDNYAEKRLEENVKKYVFACEAGDYVFLTCIAHNTFTNWKRFDAVSKQYLDAYYNLLSDYLTKGYEIVPGAISVTGGDTDGGVGEENLVLVTTLRKSVLAPKDSTGKEGANGK